MSLRIRFLLPILFVLLSRLLAAQVREQAPNTPDRRVTEALELWKGGDASARHRGLRRLARLGPRASPAVPVLITGLTDPDFTIRRESADVLRRIGPTANPAVPALTAALNDPENAVRTAAASALITTKPDPKQVIPALVASLHAGPDRRCLSAVSVLGTLGEPAVPVLIDLLKDTDPKLRQLAASSLGRMGPAAKAALPALIEALRLPERETRESVAWALAAIGPGAVEPLIVALRDRDPKVRGGAALALRTLGEQAKAAVPALLAALSDQVVPDDPTAPRKPSVGDDDIREGEPEPSGYYASIRAIGTPAVPILLERLDRPDRQGSARALRALGFLGDKAKAAVPRLVALLRDQELRLEAASALGGIGPAARAAIPALVESLKNPDPIFRAQAAEAIGRIGWEPNVLKYHSLTVAGDAVAPLTVALKDPNAGVRAAAARALSDISVESSSAIPELAARFGDPAAEVRLAALRAFPRIGRVSNRARDALIAFLKETDPRIRLAATNLLGDADLKIDAVISALLSLLKDPSADVRAAAGYKLARTNAQQGLIVSSPSRLSIDGRQSADSAALARSLTAGAALRDALIDPDPRVRTLAAQALPACKREATAAVSALTARLKDADVHVKVAAAMALGQYGRDAASAVPALLESLADPDGIGWNDYSVAEKSAQALRDISPQANDQMLNRLFALLGDPDIYVRAHAGTALVSLGEPATPRLVQTLADAKTPRTAKVEILRQLADAYGIGSFRFDEETDHRARDLQPALASLRALAHDDEPRVRTDARKILAVVEPGSESAARTLLDSARDVEPDDRAISEAEQALEPAAASVLIAGLKDPDEEVRTVAAHGLAALAGKLPRPDDEPGSEKPTPAEAEARARDLQLRSQIIDALIPALKDPDTQVGWAATWSLHAFGTSEKAVTALTEMLKDRTTRVRPGARIRIASFLGGGNFNRSGEWANGELLRLGAIQGLEGFGPLAAPAVPALIDALKDDDPVTRWSAASALGEIGPKAKAAVPELINLLRSKDDVRPTAPGFRGYATMRTGTDRLAVMAAKALGQIGLDAAAAIPDLITASKETDIRVRVNVAEALGTIGPKNREGIPALIGMMRDSDSYVRQTAAHALAMIGMPAFSPLRALLRDDDEDLRDNVAQTLARIAHGERYASEGETDAQARSRVKVPRALIAALKDPDKRVRDGASRTLGYIGEDVVPELVAALGDPSPLVRLQASRALQFIGGKATTALDALRKQLGDRDPDVRRAAEAAIKAILKTDP